MKNEVQNEIIYEDAYVIVCRKQPGVPVQSAHIGARSLESLLKTYLREKKPETVPYLGIVHRLDQPVGGILVFAKTPAAAADLSRQISSGKMEKLYLALICTDTPITEKKTLTDYLVRDGRTNMSEVVPEGTAGAKKAVLACEPFSAGSVPGMRDVRSSLNEDGLCRLQDGRIGQLLQVRLHTGRHHQIRVQMAHAGMPLLGDRKYGGLSDSPWPALAAWKLSFDHPKTHKRICFSLRAQQIWFLSL